MAQDREEITVHTLNPAHQRGPVFYASLPHESAASCGLGADREEAKYRLVSTLWDHLAVRHPPPGERPQGSPGASSPIRVGCAGLGRPQLFLGPGRGPGISFSEGGGRLWAALSGDDSDIGIDVAGTREFHGEYPFHRVFQPEELRLARAVANGELAGAAALLWSAKEAVVKALGCAFHLVDPGQIAVHPSPDWEEAEGGWHALTACLSAKALKRVPGAAGQCLLVRSLSRGKLWLSIALLNRRPAGHE